MHQGIGVTKQPNDHKNFSDLGISITELLHGSGVKFESSFTRIQGGDHHGYNFLGGLINRALVHDGFILMPIGL